MVHMAAKEDIDIRMIQYLDHGFLVWGLQYLGWGTPSHRGKWESDPSQMGKSFWNGFWYGVSQYEMYCKAQV